MKKPTDYEKCLSILVLGCLGCSQDETRSILGCRKQVVVDVEEWARTCPPDEAIGFCDDQAIKRLVGREFPTFEEISPSLLVKAGQVTADDIVRHYRKDYLRIRRRPEEEQQFLGLLQRWRQQLQFLFVDQLLKEFYFENRRAELEREATEPEEVRQAYFHAWGRHWETIPRPYKAMLPVESESLFEHLKKLHPDAEVWQAQQSWDEAYGVYWDAFVSWATKVEYVTELVMGLAADESASGDFNDKVANARQLAKEVKRAKPDVWLFLRLLTLIVACDLLVSGIEQLSPHGIWALEVAKIRKLRDDVVLTSMKELRKDFWLTCTNRVPTLAKSLWDKDEPVKEKTIALVKALERLQIAQSDVQDKLRALEHTLSS